jgi:hypothetical protein
MPPPGPTPPASGGTPIWVYPSDLFTALPSGVPSVPFSGTDLTLVGANASLASTSADQGFYTQIQMVAAQSIFTGVPGALAAGGGVFTSASAPTGAANPQSGSGVYLPLPWKINDIEMHLWNDLSFIDQIPVINDAIKLFDMGRRGAGIAQTVNPFLYMLYKQPAFREFELAWSFSPNNANETSDLAQIINYLKTGALPRYTNLLSLDYPFLALIRLNPNQFMFDFKPCAITSVNIDYTGSGHGPSFYNDGGPSIINFTLGVKEVAIQTRDDIAWRAPALTVGMV